MQKSPNTAVPQQISLPPTIQNSKEIIGHLLKQFGGYQEYRGILAPPIGTTMVVGSTIAAHKSRIRPRHRPVIWEEYWSLKPTNKIEPGVYLIIASNFHHDQFWLVLETQGKTVIIDMDARSTIGLVDWRPALSLEKLADVD